MSDEQKQLEELGRGSSSSGDNDQSLGDSLTQQALTDAHEVVDRFLQVAQQTAVLDPDSTIGRCVQSFGQSLSDFVNAQRRFRLYTADIVAQAMVDVLSRGGDIGALDFSTRDPGWVRLSGEDIDWASRRVGMGHVRCFIVALTLRSFYERLNTLPQSQQTPEGLSRLARSAYGEFLSLPQREEALYRNLRREYSVFFPELPSPEGMQFLRLHASGSISWTTSLSIAFKICLFLRSRQLNADAYVSFCIQSPRGITTRALREQSHEFILSISRTPEVSPSSPVSASSMVIEEGQLPPEVTPEEKKQAEEEAEVQADEESDDVPAPSTQRRSKRARSPDQPGIRGHSGIGLVERNKRLQEAKNHLGMDFTVKCLHRLNRNHFICALCVRMGPRNDFVRCDDCGVWVHRLHAPSSDRGCLSANQGHETRDFVEVQQLLRPIGIYDNEIHAIRKAQLTCSECHRNLPTTYSGHLDGGRPLQVSSYKCVLRNPACLSLFCRTCFEYVTPGQSQSSGSRQRLLPAPPTPDQP
jgi:hypothetical protein